MDEFYEIVRTLGKLQNVRLDKVEIMPKFASFCTTDLHPEAVYTSRCFTAKELSAGIVPSVFH